MISIKEKIKKITDSVKDKDILNLVEDTLNSFADYVKVVNEMENAISIARFTLEPEAYRERVQILDRNRRILHNGIIQGVKFLNRVSPDFYQGDITKREEVARFAMELVKENFDISTKK